MKKSSPPPIIRTRVPVALQQVFLAANRGELVDVPPAANISHLCRNWHEDKSICKSKRSLVSLSFDNSDEASLSSEDSFGVCDDIQSYLSDGDSCSETRYFKSVASNGRKMNNSSDKRRQATATIISALSETEWSNDDFSDKSEETDLSDSDWSLGDSTIDSADMLFLEELVTANDRTPACARRLPDRWSAIERQGDNMRNSAPRRYHSPVKHPKPRKVIASHLSANEMKHFCPP